MDPEGDGIPVRERMNTTYAGRPLTAVLMVAALLIVAAVPVGAYIDQQRQRADAMIAGKAVEALLRARDLTLGELDPAAYSEAMYEVVAASDNFLGSDSAQRQPVIAQHVTHASLAYQVAYWLWVAEDGDPRPLVASVHGADDAMSVFPELAGTIVGTGPEARFAKVDDALDVLWSYGAGEAEAAAGTTGGPGVVLWNPSGQ